MQIAPTNDIMLVLALLISLTLTLPNDVATRSPFFSKPAWWVNAVFYQIYPLSFQDSGADGKGDLKGIIQRIDYLKNMGVTAIWLNPIFESPMKDSGYDISDYYKIHEIYGSMKDFEALKKVLDKNGIKLILDLVPNHTSDQHPWFKKSVAKEGKYTDYYVWYEPKTEEEKNKKIPPNNWIDWISSGSAWEWNEERGAFYFHNFLKSQPELNFRNPEVVKEIGNIMEFWFKKGVDGLRIDAVPYLFEDKELRDEPLIDPNKPRVEGNVDHIYTQNQPEVFGLIETLGKFISDINERDQKDRVIFLEAHVDIKHSVKYYGGFKVNRTPRFIMPFNFLLENEIDIKSNAQTFKTVIDAWMNAMPENDVANWIIGHHDETRVATKMGEEFIDAMNMISFTLPGISVVYYGDEIGMHDTFVPYELCQDNFGKELGPDLFDTVSRDFHRTPMQWDTSVSAGFSKNDVTWLPVNSDYWKVNVMHEKAASTSHLKVFQTLVKTKKTKTMAYGSLSVQTPDHYTLVIKRELTHHPTYMLVVNTGYFIMTHDLSRYGAERKHHVKIVTASRHCNHLPGEVLKGPKFTVKLRPRSAILVRMSTSTDFIKRIPSWLKRILHD